ncbi:MAG: RNA polymerase subunit sigma [Gammaproteobacteria bacterium]|nr:MAG: RNA polymerase subunit sigma [Gammaproteobacteria bacterium]
MSNDALSTLYSENKSWLQAWLSKKLGCSHHAADVAQDAFLRILQLQRKEGALPSLKQPRAYLTTIAGRLVYDHFRRQSLEKAYLESLAHLPEVQMPSPQEQLIVQETLLELDSLFDRLKPIIRTTFLLSQLEGLTYAAIAEQLNISERTVKRYMARAFEECIMASSL